MKEEMLVDGQDEPITSMPIVNDAAHAPGLYDDNGNCNDGHDFVGVDGNGISNSTVDATVTTNNNIPSAASSASTLSNDVDGDNDDHGDCGGGGAFFRQLSSDNYEGDRNSSQRSVGS